MTISLNRGSFVRSLSLSPSLPVKGMQYMSITNTVYKGASATS